MVDFGNSGLGVGSEDLGLKLSRAFKVMLAFRVRSPGFGCLRFPRWGVARV